MTAFLSRGRHRANRHSQVLVDELVANHVWHWPAAGGVIVTRKVPWSLIAKNLVARGAASR